jgi:copper chaperone CopZ
MSHISALVVKKITGESVNPAKKTRLCARERHLQLRFKAIFVKFKSNQGMIRTKTAILSIADLKAENLAVLREAFKALPGVEKIDFNLERSVAVLEFDPSQSHIDDFLRAALKAGFQVL